MMSSETKVPAMVDREKFLELGFGTTPHLVHQAPVHGREPASVRLLRGCLPLARGSEEGQASLCPSGLVFLCLAFRRPMRECCYM